MRFTVNIATRTHLDPRQVNRVSSAVLILLAGLLVWNVSRTAWQLGEWRRLKSDISSYEERLNSRPSGVSENQYATLLTNVKFYNELIGRKAYNWLGLLDRLEAATPDGIALSLFAPDVKTGVIKIEGHAKSFSHVKTYLDKLEDSKSFTSILLLSHSVISVGEKGRGITFAVSCKAAP